MMSSHSWREFADEGWDDVRRELLEGATRSSLVGRSLRLKSGGMGPVSRASLDKWVADARRRGELPSEVDLAQIRRQAALRDDLEGSNEDRRRDGRVRGSKWARLTRAARSELVWLAAAKPEGWTAMVETRKWPTTAGRMLAICSKTVNDMVMRYGPGPDAAFRTPEEMKLDPYLRGLE